RPSGALLDRFAFPTRRSSDLPEIVLSLSALVLLLVAAWAGDRASGAISVAGCIVLAACFALVAPVVCAGASGPDTVAFYDQFRRSEEHTSELQSRENLVCRLL